MAAPSCGTAAQLSFTWLECSGVQKVLLVLGFYSSSHVVLLDTETSGATVRAEPDSERPRGRRAQTANGKGRQSSFAASAHESVELCFCLFVFYIK